VDFGLWGSLTILTAVLELMFVAGAVVFVKRLEGRTPAPLSEQVGAHKTVLHKLRNREPLSQDEVDYARQVISDSRSIFAYSIPAAIFTLGCFYVFGCLQQLHGGTPTERTFIGLIPMFTSTNLAVQLLRVARLKGRLEKPPLKVPETSDAVR